MTAKRVSMSLQVPGETRDFIEAVAKLAGVRPETVINVMLALDVTAQRGRGRNQPPSTDTGA